VTPEPEAEPAVTVSKTTGLNPEGDTVTITGTGFVPDPPSTNGTRQPLPGLFGGAYVTFGKFADDWQPSEGISSSQRKVVSQKWVVNQASYDHIATNFPSFVSQLVVADADGNFTLTLPVNEDASLAAFDGNWGIYSYPGSGAVYAPFETYTGIEFAPTPAATVSKTEGIDPAGETLTITGSGFAPNPTATNGTRQPLPGLFGGAYVTFGKFADDWQPSEGISSSQRKVVSQKWVVNQASYDHIATNFPSFVSQLVVADDDGNFSLTLPVSEDATLADFDGNWGIYTYPGSGAVYAPFETYTSVAFASAEPTPSPSPTPTPTEEPETPTVPVPVGRLTWGIDTDFRGYVTGPIAQGSISTSGASYSAGQFTFVQTGGNANMATGTGTATYGGSARFTGHGGELDLTFAAPYVRLTSPSSAVLSVSVNGSRVDFASLDLGAATRTENNGAVRFAGAPATLTSAGAVAFNGFYAAGKSLDPVTVTFGAGAVASGGGGVAVAYQAPATAPIPDEPPATEGIVLDEETLDKLLAGEQATITVSGFQAGEEVKVVIYSTPTLIGTVTADAAGDATWTGSLPTGLTGEHTLVFIGTSIAKGAVLTIPASTTAGQCLAEPATLEWGFKEDFRAYIDSTIANGEWEVSGDVTDEGGIFTWTGGSGVLDRGPLGEVAFSGSLRFTGHEGVLDTTVSDPVVEFTADGAYLLLDVSGETQQGAAVDASRLRFAELDLAAGTLAEIDGAAVYSDVPAVLTAAGAEAFGTYPEGEPLDPVTLTLESDGCALLAAGLAADPMPSVEPEPTVSPEAEASDAAGGLASWVLWTLAGVLAAIIAVTIYSLIRRNRA
jgi:hypothetical protein